MIEWMEQTDPEPSWAGIVEALRSHSVGEGQLAECVERNMSRQSKQTDNPTLRANAGKLWYI